MVLGVFHVIFLNYKGANFMFSAWKLAKKTDILNKNRHYFQNREHDKSISYNNKEKKYRNKVGRLK